MCEPNPADTETLRQQLRDARQSWELLDQEHQELKRRVPAAAITITAIRTVTITTIIMCSLAVPYRGFEPVTYHRAVPIRCPHGS